MKKLFPFLAILLIPASFLMAQGSGIKLSVSPDSSLFHKPLQIQAKGFGPEQEVTIEVNAIDAEGNKWVSSAAFATDEFGIVDPSKSEALRGSYSGIHPMGIFWSMKSMDDHQIATGKGFTATINVIFKDSIVASKTIYRRSTRELGALDVNGIAIRDSIIANYYLPKSKKRLPVIIFLGGSGGQFRQERSSLFTSEGFAVLNLKYFKYEGLPDGITEIPLEYVAKAHHWLKNQPDIDSTRIGIMGRSMGSQLALLYAAHYDGLQYVVVEAPSGLPPY